LEFDQPFSPLVPITHSINLVDSAMIRAQWASVRQMSNVSTGLEAFMQLLLPGGPLAPEIRWRNGARRVVILAACTQPGVQGDITLRLLAPLTEFLANGSSAPFPVLNNYNNIMEADCTLRGKLCGPPCGLRPAASPNILPSAICTCGLRTNFVDITNYTQFYNGSCEDFPTPAGVAAAVNMSGVAAPELIVFAPVPTSAGAAQCTGTREVGFYESLIAIMGGGGMIVNDTLDLQNAIGNMFPPEPAPPTVNISGGGAADIVGYQIISCNASLCIFNFTFNNTLNTDANAVITFDGVPAVVYLRVCRLPTGTSSKSASVSHRSDSRSRSHSSSHASKSRSHSSSHHSLNETRSISHRSNSRSHSASHMSASRHSKSHLSKSRSPSHMSASRHSKSHHSKSHRSNSHSRSASHMSKSHMSKSHHSKSHRSKSHSHSASHMSKSHMSKSHHSKSHRSKSRSHSASHHSLNETRSRSHHSRSESPSHMSKSHRSRSHKSQSHMSKSRSHSHHSKSRSHSASHMSASHMSKSHHSRSHESRSHSRSRESNSYSSSHESLSLSASASHESKSTSHVSKSPSHESRSRSASSSHESHSASHHSASASHAKKPSRRGGAQYYWLIPFSVGVAYAIFTCCCVFFFGMRRRRLRKTRNVTYTDKRTGQKHTYVEEYF
jgi:hypothetical protein